MNETGNITETINGTVNLEPDVTAADATELVEELADIATITEIMDNLILATSEIFQDLINQSLTGNPVLTHVVLVDTTEEVVRALYDLRRQLIDSLAKRGEEIPQKGGNLRTQVVDAGDN